MILEYATKEHIYAVAAAMRESDYREFSALSTEDTRGKLAVQLARRFAGRSDVMVATDDNVRPIAVGGLIEHRPNVVSLLFFATDAFPEIGLELTKVIKRDMIPPLKVAGVHRIEATAMADHVEAHRWIRSLGLEPEAMLRGFGKGGETYQSFAWVSDAL